MKPNSGFVKEVLNSKEFQFWMPKTRTCIELTIFASLGIATFLSAGLGCIATLATIHKVDSTAGYFFRVFTLSLLFLIIYLAIFGFGQTRVITFDAETLEIESARDRLIKCNWTDILEVKPIARRGFELITAQGSIKVWWSPFLTQNAHNSLFILNVFRAMTEGKDSQSLIQYKVPVELVEGGSFIYEYKAQKLFLAIYFALLCLLMVFSVYDLAHKKDVLLATIRLILFSMMLCLHGITEWSKIDRSHGVSLKIVGGQIIVNSNGKTTTYQLQRLKEFNEPNLRPTLFEGSEKYGTAESSIEIDRRFLVTSSA
jgi:hypothetical protein